MDLALNNLQTKPNQSRACPYQVALSEHIVQAKNIKFLQNELIWYKLLPLDI